MTPSNWAFHRCALNHRDLIDLLAVRSVCMVYETIRRWVEKFGVQAAKQTRAAPQRRSAKWRLDQAVIKIRGVKHWPRRSSAQIHTGCGSPCSQGLEQPDRKFAQANPKTLIGHTEN